MLESLVEYVAETKENGVSLSQNPVIRHKLAERAIELETLKMLSYEIAWKMSQGVVPIYEASRNKSYGDDLQQRMANTGTEILGAYSQIDQNSKFAKLRGTIQHLYLLFPGITIAAGTDEIEKNIIGQFKLGLPKSY
jgi:alkylation response protein AidB-like acyl-CoA dehydrogenase